MIPPSPYIGVGPKFKHYHTFSLTKPRILYKATFESPSIGMVQVQTDLQTKYKEFRERNVQISQRGQTRYSRMITSSDNQNDVLRSFVVKPILPYPIVLKGLQS